MVSDKDLKGYYKILGVPSGAPPSVIRAAYRALAMDLHPDRNPHQDTTTQFQNIQEAYAALSDENMRQHYDADSAVPRRETAFRDGSYKPIEPILCSQCGAVSMLPRYKVFYAIYGYIFGATRKPNQGVFCSKCETKVALQSSAITLVAGWWSFSGFRWTLQSLVQNFVGGNFNQQNAQLQAHQAMYFAHIGKADLARAMAVNALKIAEKAVKDTNQQNRFEKIPGYEPVDTLSILKETLTNFINSFPANTKVVELKLNGGIFSRRFVYQFLLLMTI